jgi:hypothetical protein
MFVKVWSGKRDVSAAQYSLPDGDKGECFREEGTPAGTNRQTAASVSHFAQRHAPVD